MERAIGTTISPVSSSKGTLFPHAAIPLPPFAPLVCPLGSADTETFSLSFLLQLRSQLLPAS